jgi:hypothetical protein
MKRALFALPLLLTAASAPALSENWRATGSTGGAVGYVDTDSVKRQGDEVRFWTEIRYSEPQSLPAGKLFDRMAALVEIDCRAKTYRSVRIRANLGGRLVHQGKIPNDRPDPVRPGTNIDAQMRAVCLGDWASGG